MRRAALLLAVMGLVATTLTVDASGATSLPRIKHLFVIVLENENQDVSFGPGSKAPYLAKRLTALGQHLDQYYGIGHFSLDNYIAMVSGQAPNIVTQSDCQIFMDWLPPAAVFAPGGQVVGQGCVHPPEVKTVADQLAAKGLRWKGYMEDMGNSPTEPKSCRHPELNGQDHTQSAKVGDQYAARHNPFVYFHSIIDSPACKANVVPLERLTDDLKWGGRTPNFSFITPNLCHDGHDAPCVNGEPGGLVSADAFLRKWVPRILASPAYKEDGMLIVTFDEAEIGDDASACCGEQPGPNSPLPGQTGPGGGRVGAVVLSRFVKPGSVNHTPYNHYSFLRSVEDLFGLPHLGFAGTNGLKPFGGDVFGRSGH